MDGDDDDTSHQLRMHKHAINSSENSLMHTYDNDNSQSDLSNFDQPQQQQPQEQEVDFFAKPQAALAVVFVALFSDYLLLTVIIPIVPLYLKDQGISAFETGVLFSSKAFVQILANPMCGRITDRYGPRIPLFAGLVVLALSTLGFAWATSYVGLLLARAIQGVASAATMTAGMTLVSLTFPLEERGEAMGTAIGGLALGVLLGPPCGGLAFVDTPLGRKLPFVLIAGVLVVNAAFQLQLHVPAHGRREEEPLSIIQLLGDSHIRVISGSLVLANMAIAMLEPLISTFLHHEVGVRTSLTGIVFIAATLSYGVMSPIVGAMGNRVSRPTLITGGSVILATSLSLLGLTREVALCILCLVGIGSGMALIDSGAMPLLAEICETRFNGHFGAVFALSDTAFAIGYVIGPLFGTFTFQYVHGFLGAMLVMSGLFVLYLPLLCSMRGGAYASVAGVEPLLGDGGGGGSSNYVTIIDSSGRQQQQHAQFV